MKNGEKNTMKLLLQKETTEVFTIAYCTMTQARTHSCDTLPVNTCTPHPDPNGEPSIIYCRTLSWITLPPAPVHQLLKSPIEPCQLSPICTLFDLYMLIKPRLRGKNV